MRVDTDEPEIIERVAALDVAKGEVVCCAEGGGDIRLGALDLAAAGGDKGSR